MFVAGTSHEHTDEEEFFSIEWYIDIRDITFFFFFWEEDILQIWLHKTYKLMCRKS